MPARRRTRGPVVRASPCARPGRVRRPLRPATRRSSARRAPGRVRRTSRRSHVGIRRGPRRARYSDVGITQTFALECPFSRGGTMPGPGNDLIDELEVEAVTRVLRSGYLGRYGPDDDSFGAEVLTLERSVAELVGVRHSVAVNAGTSAIWILLSA